MMRFPQTRLRGFRAVSANTARICTDAAAANAMYAGSSLEHKNTHHHAIGSMVRISSTVYGPQNPKFLSSMSRIHFSSTSGGGDDDKDGKKSNNEEDSKKESSFKSEIQELTDKMSASSSSNDDDPFGISYQDGEDGLGPEEDLPPRLIRDPTTGALTGESERELSNHDKHLLNLTSEERYTILAERVEQAWSEEKEDRLLQRMERRTAEIASVVRENHPEQKQWESEKRKQHRAMEKKERDRDEAFRRAKRRDMTEEEEEYQKLKETHGLHSYDSSSSGFFKSSDAPKSGKFENWKFKKGEDDALKAEYDPERFPPNAWESDNLQWIADDANPFNDDIVLPAGFHKAKLLNQAQATRLPKEEIHHNNLALLRKYVTPGGQIKSRVQTRLGARDQRKVSKLIKRARALGIIPHIGQWKVKDDGDLFAEDLEEKNHWEKVLERAGILGEQSGVEAAKKEKLIKQARVIKENGEIIDKTLARRIDEVLAGK
mmetsp:Transcript_36503/g.53522  ORF Transcript_36503/g.53522 Transcript_36503/m.53522 type:complete len:489 (-) Transcript_36503:136-1602(-)|eukprot:CAMPEP_0195523644 /NCGR_PEP_ID=MMETSP0794_2-20130614/22962_1 /TAXON_ID=515487 /ORGANISM="Stephanopyxis turris, Strain CCMP 815" /LENGTH=488 /DNA_ID=CAMNT_0040653685 /DNA_START=109 /DNA_END=1575 /DNA_ORIENTATION=+